MKTYSLKDRLKEISSYMGVLLVGLATYLSYHASPDDPTKYISPVLQVLGSFGIAMPEGGTQQSIEQVVQLVLAQLEAAKKVAAMLFAAVLLSSGLAGCSYLTSLTGTAAAPLTPAQMQQNIANAQYFLEASGCAVSAAASTASPIVQISADTEGNQVLAAVNAAGTLLCKLTLPPTALPAPAAPNAPPASAPLVAAPAAPAG